LMWTRTGRFQVNNSSKYCNKVE